jgi:hypothetical protein
VNHLSQLDVKTEGAFYPSSIRKKKWMKEAKNSPREVFAPIVVLVYELGNALLQETLQKEQEPLLT